MELTLLATLLPAVMDLFKGGVQAAGRKWFGVSVDDQLKIDAAGVERMKALAEMDNPHGTPSQWVVDLRGSFRYISAAVSIALGGTLMFMGADQAAMGYDLVGIPFGFIFGERLWMGLKGPGNK